MVAFAAVATGCSGFATPGAPTNAAGAVRAGSEGSASPARLASPSDAATRAAVLAALRELVGDRALTLADDAFAKDNELVLERTRPPGEAGRLATGREMAPPIRVRLLSTGGRCLLERGDTGSRAALSAVRCTALSIR